MSILGITYRDYFAIRAPDTIPTWFVPVGIPTEPTIPMNPNLYFGDKSNAATYDPLYVYYDRPTNYWDDAAYQLEVTDGVIPSSLKSDVSVYWGAYDYAVAIHNEWTLEKNKETYFQWRYYFAEEMLLARTGTDLS